MPFGIRLAPCAPRNRRASQRLPPALAARKPRLRLLGGFAGGIDPKRRMAPAFPQVGEATSGQPPPKTVRKCRAHGEIGARFLQNRPEVAGHKRLLNSDTLFASKTGTPSDKLQASKKVFKRKELFALYGS